MTSIILLWLTLTSTNKTMHFLTVHLKKKIKLYKEINAKDLSRKVTLKLDCFIIVISFSAGTTFFFNFKISYNLLMAYLLPLSPSPVKQLNISERALGF